MDTDPYKICPISGTKSRLLHGIQCTTVYTNRRMRRTDICVTFPLGRKEGMRKKGTHRVAGPLNRQQNRQNVKEMVKMDVRSQCRHKEMKKKNACNVWCM